MIDIGTATTEEIITAIRLDKDAVLTQLVTRYHAGMISLARSFLKSNEAEEVVQDAWISAYKGLANFEGRSNIRTWLSRIVINEAGMRLRKAGRDVVVDFSSMGDAENTTRFGEDGKWSEPPLNWEINSPDELLQEQNLLDCLHKTIEELPLNQKLVLELRDIQGRELDDICNILEISTSNVRVLLHRARLQLYNMVDHYQGSGEC